MGQGATQDDGSTTATTRGARFFRADLHIHSINASHDVSDPGATPEAIVASAKALDLDIIALADRKAGVRVHFLEAVIVESRL